MADSADDKWEARAIKAEADAAKWRELHDKADHRAFAYSQRIEALLAVSREARHFMMAPAEDLLWGVIGRLDAAISKAEGRP